MKTFCNGCIYEGDYHDDPYGLDYVSENGPHGYFPIIDCNKKCFKPRKKGIYKKCSYYEKLGQLSLFD